MSINWYPGHMAKSRRLMTADMKNVDVVCEILDARIPCSSRNPELEKMAKGKRRMLVLNRADQANPEITGAWCVFFRGQGYTVLESDSKKGGFLSAFTAAANDCCQELIARNRAKGQEGKRIRIMIVGIPNVGKSSFINRLVGKKSAMAADKPGVTRLNQWFSLPGVFDFMDTPGMLWPKIENDITGYRLAFCGTIRNEILDLEDVACRLIEELNKLDPQALVKRYASTVNTESAAYDQLILLAKSRGFLKSRGEADTERMARTLLNEFQEGKLGRVTLEYPPRAEA